MNTTSPTCHLGWRLLEVKSGVPGWFSGGFKPSKKYRSINHPKKECGKQHVTHPPLLYLHRFLPPSNGSHGSTVSMAVPRLMNWIPDQRIRWRSTGCWLKIVNPPVDHLLSYLHHPASNSRQPSMKNTVIIFKWIHHPIIFQGKSRTCWNKKMPTSQQGAAENVDPKKWSLAFNADPKIQQVLRPKTNHQTTRQVISGVSWQAIPQSYPCQHILLNAQRV